MVFWDSQTLYHQLVTTANSLHEFCLYYLKCMHAHKMPTKVAYVLGFLISFFPTVEIIIFMFLFLRSLIPSSFSSTFIASALCGLSTAPSKKCSHLLNQSNWQKKVAQLEYFHCSNIHAALFCYGLEILKS